MEDGTITLIGATTENPYFEVNGALISRSSIFELNPLEKEDIKTLLHRAVYDMEKGMGSYQAVIDDEALEFLADISGGERQRTAVARSLINDPLLILADEPTGNLDSKSSRAVIEAFEKAKSEMGSTILMVTHDSFSASFCDRVILLKDGVIYKQLNRIGSQNSFQGYLLDTIKEMSEAEQV